MYSEKTCPGDTLSTANPTWPDPGLNPGRRGGKPATNRFSYGAAQEYGTKQGKLIVRNGETSLSILNLRYISK
jgi:hypothetical protein